MSDNSEAAAPSKSALGKGKDGAVYLMFISAVVYFHEKKLNNRIPPIQKTVDLQKIMENSKNGMRVHL